MQIGIFYRDCFDQGGVPREVSCLAASLTACANTVRIITCQAKLSSIKNELPEKVDIYVLRSKSSLFLLLNIFQLRALYKYISSCDCIYIVGSFLPINNLVAYVARIAKIPYIVRPASFSPYIIRKKKIIKYLFLNILDKTLLTKSLFVHVYSQYHQRCINNLNLSAKYETFLEGIDWSNLEGLTELHSGCGLENDILKLGYIGRIDVYAKGLDTLLETASNAYLRDNRFKLYFAGPDQNNGKNQLLKSAKNKNTASMLIFLGKLSRHELCSFIRELDVVVLLSRGEGVPRCLREAIALNCPIIVTEESNFADVIRENNIGAVVSRDDTSLEELILSLTNDKSQIDIWKNNMIKVREKLDWDSIGPEMSRAIERHLKRSNYETK